jgi:hypothetical protein
MNQPELNIVDLASSPKGRRHESTGKKQFLTMVQDHALINLILTEYVQSGMTDADFAKYAEEKLKIAPGSVKDHTIKMRRDQFKIANNKARGVNPADNASLTAAILAQGQRVTALEERIAVLEGWVNSTFPNKGPRKQL